jgi:hypothetical protein
MYKLVRYYPHNNKLGGIYAMGKLNPLLSTLTDKKDCTFSTNDNGISSLASKLEYIKNTVNLVLFTKGGNPYNDCKVDFNSAYYKTSDQINETIKPEVERCIREYTDFSVMEVNMTLAPDNKLVVYLTLLDNGVLYIVSANSDEGVTNVLPAKE